MRRRSWLFDKTNRSLLVAIATRDYFRGALCVSPASRSLDFTLISRLQPTRDPNAFAPIAHDFLIYAIMNPAGSDVR